jgi:hypothetical protein
MEWIGAIFDDQHHDDTASPSAQRVKHRPGPVNYYGGDHVGIGVVLCFVVIFPCNIPLLTL